MKQMVKVNVVETHPILMTGSDRLYSRLVSYGGTVIHIDWVGSIFEQTCANLLALSTFLSALLRGKYKKLACKQKADLVYNLRRTLHS
jgi:hypothetical protein